MNKRTKKSKKKSEVGEVLEIVNFIKNRMMTAREGKEMEERLSDRMMTKDDGAAMEKRLSDKIDGMESKASGIQRSLDAERMQRTDRKIPRRLHDVEEKVYGVGGSKHPKHIYSERLLYYELTTKI